MIITVPTITENNTRRPALPEGVGFSLIEDHGDTMTVKVSEDVTDWAIENGYLIPTEVRTGHLMAALLDFDEQLFDTLEQMIQQNKTLRAALYDPHVSRSANLVEQLREEFNLTSEQVDALFVAAWQKRF